MSKTLSEDLAKPSDTSLESEWAAVDHVITNWHRRVRDQQLTHYAAAESNDKWHKGLGIIAIIFSSFAGVGAVTNIIKSWGDRGIYVMAFLTLTSAFLSSLQTFLKLSERAEKHRASAAHYAAIRRDLEKTAALLPVSRGKPKAYLDGIQKQMDALAKESPVVSNRLFSSTIAKASGYSPLKPDKTDQNAIEATDNN